MDHLNDIGYALCRFMDNNQYQKAHKQKKREEVGILSSFLVQHH
jgi:hypothetical protein